MDQNRLYKKKRKSGYRHVIFLLLICICIAAAGSVIYAVKQNKLQGNDNLGILSPVKSSGSKSMDSSKYEGTKVTWYLTLVNKWNIIPEDYEVQLIELSNGESVDERIYSSLQKMFDTARDSGVYPIVVSGYRTTQRQQELLDEKISAYIAEDYPVDVAKTEAEKWVAIPGTSEHQLGLAVDINADGVHSTDEEVYQWLEENAYKYGFIFRYPPEKTELTGIYGEPWHYRYVGEDTAAEMYNQGLCLEEYMKSL